MTGRTNRPNATARLYGTLLLAAAAAGAAWSCGKEDASAETAAAPPATLLGADAVIVVDSGDVSSGPVLSGALAAARSAEIAAQVSGTVERVLVEEGTAVKAGQPLLRIDATAITEAYQSAQAQLRTAEVNAQLAARNKERNERLGQAGAISERDVETASYNATSAQSAVEDARSRLATAAKQVGNTNVRAPFAGIVSERPANAGDVVQPGAPLVTVVDPSSMRLEASVPAAQLALLKVGSPVSFTVSGYGDRRFEGKIERINPAADPETRQVRLYVNIPNKGGTLVAGLFAEGRVATEQRKALALPLAAVAPGTRPSVLRIKGGVVEQVPVEIGLRDDVAERVEITGGIARGDTVLANATAGTGPGSRVTVRQD